MVENTFNGISTNVSRETFLKLKTYQDNLYKWNQKINLIGVIESDEIWQRHIIDSLQLIDHLPSEKITIADLGSGAGLPGAIIAMSTQHYVTLIDKSYKKSAFLRFVSRETNCDFEVCNKNFKDITEKFDVIVSRALMKCLNFYKLAVPMLKKNGYILLLKGESVQDEIKELTDNFNVTYELYPSITNSTSSIVKIFKED